jgi:hypothetical protein
MQAGIPMRGEVMEVDFTVFPFFLFNCSVQLSEGGLVVWASWLGQPEQVMCSCCIPASKTNGETLSLCD